MGIRDFLQRTAAEIVNRQMEHKANHILAEIQAEIKPHSRTGRTAGSFDIMPGDQISGSFSVSSFGVRKSIIIGSDYRPALWLNDGNAQKGSPIRPKRAKVLKFPDTRRGGTGMFYYKPEVNTYAGIHYIEKVAARHGGYR